MSTMLYEDTVLQYKTGLKAYWAPLLAGLDAGTASDTYVRLDDYLRQSTVVQVHNVAEFYFRDAKRAWSLRNDFPQIAPPWPVAWYEWRIPPLDPQAYRPEVRVGLSHARQGVLVIASEFDPNSEAARARYMHALAYLGVLNDLTRNRPGEAVTEYSEQVIQMAQRQPADIWAHVLDETARMRVQRAADRAMGNYQREGVRWWCNAFVFIQTHPGDKPLLISALAWPVTALGAFVTNGSADADVEMLSALLVKRGTMGWIAPHRVAELKEDDATGQEWVVDAEHLHIPLLAVAFAHCRNVAIDEVHTPEKLARKQVERRGMARPTYKVLVIDPQKPTKIRPEEGGQAEGAQRALHICRGHFAHYEAGRGLFGRWHGMYWRPMHVRGNRAHGEVIKGYQVKEGTHVTTGG